MKSAVNEIHVDRLEADTALPLDEISGLSENSNDNDGHEQQREDRACGLVAHGALQLLLRQARAVGLAAMVRGQYEGFLDEDGVAPDSTTETYVAARLEIESWRWAGVPFYVRCGKALGASATEVAFA